ncbi:MAG: cytochrome c biogenesis protein CcsA [Deltaproteobacteria bacterium]|nr:cytochrome c biogenesis protein CcsA [Deltaproteobacteria bacterium]
MNNIDGIFLWLAIAGYSVSFLVSLAGLIFKRDKWVDFGFYIFIVSFGFHTISFISRWLITWHPPVYGQYENSLTASWFISVSVFAIKRWSSKIGAVAAILTPIILFVMGNGVMAKPSVGPLPPPFQSNWLWVHVTFAWFGFGSVMIAGGIAIIYILKDAAKQRANVMSGWFPSLEVLDDLIFRFIFFGFITLTVEIGAGAIWANGLWGRYWGWDPMETWSLIMWLIYGINMHLRVTLGWKGRKAAWLALLSIISVFIAFFGIGFFGSIHTHTL